MEDGQQARPGPALALFLFVSIVKPLSTHLLLIN